MQQLTSNLGKPCSLSRQGRPGTALIRLLSPVHRVRESDVYVCLSASQRGRHPRPLLRLWVRLLIVCRALGPRMANAGAGAGRGCGSGSPEIPSRSRPNSAGRPAPEPPSPGCGGPRRPRSLPLPGRPACLPRAAAPGGCPSPREGQVGGGQQGVNGQRGGCRQKAGQEEKRCWGSGAGPAGRVQTQGALSAAAAAL